MRRGGKNRRKKNKRREEKRREEKRREEKRREEKMTRKKKDECPCLKPRINIAVLIDFAHLLQAENQELDLVDSVVIFIHLYEMIR